MTYAYATSPGDVERPPTEIGGRAIIAHGGRRTADDAADGCSEPQSRLIGEIGFSSAVLELARSRCDLSLVCDTSSQRAVCLAGCPDAEGARSCVSLFSLPRPPTLGELRIFLFSPRSLGEHGPSRSACMCGRSTPRCYYTCAYTRYIHTRWHVS